MTRYNGQTSANYSPALGAYLSMKAKEIKMQDSKYNGYTNYETWCVNLWIDNDESSQDFWLEQAEHFLAVTFVPAYDSQTPEQKATYDLSEELKDYHEENAPGPNTGVYSDLLTHALGAVNWYEIAENLIEQANENANAPQI